MKKEVFKVRATRKCSTYVTPKLTFKDLDNIEWAMENMNGILEANPKKQKQFRATYLKIYMALKKKK